MKIIKEKYCWIFCFCLFGSVQGLAQIIGIPFVDSYTKEEYGYGTQNWDIDQGESGLMYFANNEGLLEFNGSDWELFQLPNQTILRSILFKDEKIYAGGQNEFGIFEADIRNNWHFKSLKHIIPKPYQGFEDVWELESVGENIYFRSLEKIYIITGEKCQVLEEVPIHFLGKAGNSLFVQDKRGPLYTLMGESLQIVPGSELLNDTEVKKVISLDDRFLIATHKNGLFLYDGMTLKKWEGKNGIPLYGAFIETIDLLENGDIVVGTGDKGVIIIDRFGELKYHLEKEDGLSNDRVITTFLDRQKNLWLGTDNGISMVQTNSPFTRILSHGEWPGAGYDVKIYKDKIYFGSSSGLFFTEWKPTTISDDFRLVENTQGQVWGIDLIDDKLILNHYDGAFLVNNSKASRFYGETGSWLFENDQTQRDIIFAGTYKGISAFAKETLQKLYDIPGLTESSRFIVQDAFHNYWMSHPYRGIYRISHPHNPKLRKVRLLGPEQGLPSFLHNHVFKIYGEVLICAERGVFSFDKEKEYFVPYEPINQYFGEDVKVRRLFEGIGGDVWFITEKEIGVLEMKEQGLTRTITKRTFPELKPLMNGGWEKIYPFDENHVFIATINGFIHYDGNHKSADTSAFDIVLNEMVVNKDSTLFPGTDPDRLVFAHNHNSLLFNVAATQYVHNEALKFQYFLRGFDEDWTPLSTLRAKEYTKLPSGIYELNVRAVNQKGDFSSTYKLDFEIKKPWYVSNPAVVFYLLLFITGAYLLYARTRRRYRVLEKKMESTRKEIQRGNRAIGKGKNTVRTGS